MIKMPLDTALFIYIALVLVSLYGFALFEWWRKKAAHASEVYLYVELLMLANFFYHAFNTYARWTYLGEPKRIMVTEYDLVITSCAWGLRAVPVLIIICLIVGRMTFRAFGPWKVTRFINDNGKDKT